MRNIVLYTCVAGGYDKIISHSVRHDKIDYICFSDKPVKSNFWKIRETQSICKLQDCTLINRFFKWNPHLLFPDYEYSIYIDSNIDVKTKKFYERIYELIDSNVEISMAHHPERSSIYDEIQACLDLHKETEGNIQKFLREIDGKFIDDKKLYFNGMMLRMHNRKKIVMFNKTIWNFLLKYIKRDQIILPYVRQRYQLDIVDFNPNFFPPVNLLCLYGAVWYGEHGNFDKSEIEYDIYVRLYNCFIQMAAENMKLSANCR